MKSNGSVYVAAVFALLAGYFTYQWWFNPSRAIKRQLGELAATLSVPPDSRSDMDRLARLARLRGYFAPDVQVTMGPRLPQLTSRDALVGAIAAWNPPAGGWDISFGDVQITLDSDSTARAYLTVAITSTDPATGQPAVDTREARVGMAKRDDIWVITTAEPIAAPPRP
jgi:SnoaL-like domain